MPPIIKDVDWALERLVVQIICAATDEIYITHTPVVDKVLDNIKAMIGENKEFYSTTVLGLTGEKIDQTLTSCFEDGKMNWGRIVSVLSLLYVYAEQRKDCSVCKRQLKDVFTKALLKHAAPWIRMRGGMNDYVKPCRHLLCMYAFVVAIAIFLF